MLKIKDLSVFVHRKLAKMPVFKVCCDTFFKKNTLKIDLWDIIKRFKGENFAFRPPEPNFLEKIKIQATQFYHIFTGKCCKHWTFVRQNVTLER